MYHSHHNATDQVGRGLLGAFIVDPKPEPVEYDREYIWISNDSWAGSRSTATASRPSCRSWPRPGETVRVRFMNEGIMMHPWHLHGMPMRVVARDGWPLGSASFNCDTLGVNPGERYDVLIEAKTLGIWAFHCHILPHAEGADGMFGMVNTLIVVPRSEGRGRDRRRAARLGRQGRRIRAEAAGAAEEPAPASFHSPGGRSGPPSCRRG